MKELAKEYLRNVEILENRISELKELMGQSSSQEEKRKLRVRIRKLCVMVNEGRKNAFQMEHYYDKPEEQNFTVNKQKYKPKTRKRFNTTGYGPPAPAAAMGSGESDQQTVSSLGDVFLGKCDADGYCTRSRDRNLNGK
ncbi:MAG: hypothetical protein Q4F79_12490 [Eubacteriales bacterium]|nr:hypothetical protein [Eubacteriales bacterium]